MPRPIVEVTQTVANIVTTVNEPEQRVVLVGPQYDVRLYDATIADNSSSLVEADFDPFVGENTSMATFSPDPQWLLSETGTIDELTTGETPRIHLEGGYFSVSIGNQDVYSNNDDVTAASLSTLKRGSAFASPTATSLFIAAGDRVHIRYKLATEFVPNVGQTIDKTKVLSTTTATVAIDGEAATETILLHSNVNAAGNVYLADPSAQAQKDLATLNRAAGTEATLSVINGGNTTNYTGTLKVPDEQVSFVAASYIQTNPSANGDSILLIDKLRAHIKSGATAATQQMDVRVDRSIQTAFNLSTIEINILDDIAAAQKNFVIDTSNAGSNYLQMDNPVDLKDTNIAGISTLLSNAGTTDHFITTGKLYMSRRSLVSDKYASIRDVNNTTLLATAGVATPSNPLGLAASVALANSGSSSIGILAIASDNTAGYSGALSVLNADPAVYAIVPLSTDLSAVITPYVNAAVAQSVPKKGKFRIVLGASEPCPTKKYFSGGPGVYATGDIALVAGTTFSLTDSAATFVASGVTTSDTILIGTTEYSIDSIEDNTEIRIDSAALAASVGTDVNFQGYKDISTNRAEQVTLLSSTISSASNKRLVMVYPGTCTIGIYANLKGYYLSAAIGGMLANFEPHRPKNQIAMAGIADIETSNLGFFSDKQIDDLTDAGYFILIQDVAAGAPYCVHQVTTDYKSYASTQEYSELSVLNNFDYVSSTFKNSLTPYVGVWNVVPSALSSMRGSLDAAALMLKNKSRDRIGPPLLSMDITTLETSAADSGTITIVLNIRIPRVLNTITLELVSD